MSILRRWSIRNKGNYLEITDFPEKDWRVIDEEVGVGKNKRGGKKDEIKEDSFYS